MKFTVSSSALLSLLATTGKVISNKNTLPILDYFLMELKGEELTVTTSDLETTIIGHLKVESVEREGVIAAPAKLMLDSLKEFPEMPLEFEVNDTTWEIKVKWTSGSLSIPGASAVSYPAMPAIGAECKDILLDVDMLIAGINKTIFATADDELRPVMNGVYFNFEQGKLTFVATDAHKLVRSMVECPDVDFNASFILPKKPANLLKGVLLKEEEPIRVMFDAKNVTFELKNHKLVCRLIEGNYPNYNAVIPTSNPYRAIIDRQTFASALKRVCVCCNKSSGLVKLHLSQNNIDLIGKDNEHSTSAEDHLMCEYNNNNISIGFSCQLLIDICNIISSENIILELADPSRPGLIRPAVEEEGNELIMLLMPMRVDD